MSSNKKDDKNFEKPQYKKKSIYLLEQDIKNLKKRMNSPKVELIECGSMYHIKIELPGVDKNSIKIQIKEHQVVLISASKPNVEMENSKIIYKEYTCGDFMRRVKLPNIIKYKHYNSDNISYVDGVLSLSFEKSNNLQKTDNLQKVKNINSDQIQSGYEYDTNKDWHEMI